MKTFKGFFFFLPALLFLAIFTLIPFLTILWDSFFETNLVTRGKFIFLNNYINLFHDSNFWWALLNSFVFMIVTPILIILSLMLSLLIRDSNKVNNFFRQTLFLPVITPIVVVGIIWKWIFSEDIGLLNYLLSLFNIDQVKWLTIYPINLFSIMIVTIWRGIGYYMIIFLAGLMSLPKELEEASILDGATYLQKLFYIIVPILKPSIIFVFVTSSTAAIKIFTEIYIMLPGAPNSNKALISYLYFQSFEQFNFGYGSAIGVIIFVITLGFSIVNIKLMEKN